MSCHSWEILLMLCFLGPPGIYYALCQIYAKDHSFSCNFREDGYELFWEFDGQLVNFRLRGEQPTGHENFYHAVGFGNGHMVGMDVVAVVRSNNSVRVLDRYSTSYAGSANDKLQSLEKVSTTFNDGVLEARFSRPLETGDPEDNSLRGCQFFTLPVGGGPAYADGRIKIHFKTPLRLEFCNIALNCPSETLREDQIVPEPENIRIEERQKTLIRGNSDKEDWYGVLEGSGEDFAVESLVVGEPAPEPETLEVQYQILKELRHMNRFMRGEFNSAPAVSAWRFVELTVPIILLIAI